MMKMLISHTNLNRYKQFAENALDLSSEMNYTRYTDKFTVTNSCKIL